MLGALLYCRSPGESHVLLACMLEKSKQNQGSGHTLGIQVLHLALLNKTWGIIKSISRKKIWKGYRQEGFHRSESSSGFGWHTSTVRGPSPLLTWPCCLCPITAPLLLLNAVLLSRILTFHLTGEHITAWGMQWISAGCRPFSLKPMHYPNCLCLKWRSLGLG